MRMRSLDIKKKDKLLAVFAYLICLVVAIWIVETKDNYHIDEIFTYGLSNHQYVDTTEMRVVEGKRYEPAGNAWYDYMVVQPDGRFDYANVWKNQREDVHPIFYYVLVHTISSFFPEQFSRWFAGSVNVIFLLLTLYAVRKLIDSFTQDKKIIFAVSVYFSLCGGIILATEMFRMYIVAMFFVTLLTELFIRLYKSCYGRESDRMLYAKIIMASVLGALTHYYVIVYLVLLCIVYSILILIEKKLGDFAKLVGCMVTSAVGAVIIFPAMLGHFFVSDRGKQSMEGLVESSLQNYIVDLQDYAAFLNEYLFGGMALLVLLILFVLLVVRRPQIELQRQNAGKMLILIVPSILYFLLISRVAVYNTDRYIHPIYGVTVTAGIYMIYFVVHAVMRKGLADLFIMLSLFIMMVGSWFGSGVLRFETVGENDTKINYEDYDAIYIYMDEEQWRVQAGFWKFKDCKSILFLSDDGFDFIYDSGILEEEEILVIIQDEIEDADFYLASVVGVCSNLEKYVEADHEGYATVYYLD